MTKLEMKHVKNGTGNNPLYQIGTVDPSGVFTPTILDLFKEHQALAYLEKHVEPEEVVVEVSQPTVVVTEETTISTNFKSMTKLQLEALMREHGIELDRRRTKQELVQEVQNYFN